MKYKHGGASDIVNHRLNRACLSAAESRGPHFAFRPYKHTSYETRGLRSIAQHHEHQHAEQNNAPKPFLRKNFYVQPYAEVSPQDRHLLPVEIVHASGDKPVFALTLCAQG